MVKGVFQGLRSQMEDLNIAQLDRGERADGSSLPNYSPNSVAFFGKRPGPMNLHHTGRFWQGITAIVDDDGVEFVGKDIKTAMLQLRYGDDIIGLSEESNDELVLDFAEPEMGKAYHDYFGL